MAEELHALTALHRTARELELQVVKIDKLPGEECDKSLRFLAQTDDGLYLVTSFVRQAAPRCGRLWRWTCYLFGLDTETRLVQLKGLIGRLTATELRVLKVAPTFVFPEDAIVWCKQPDAVPDSDNDSTALAGLVARASFELLKCGIEPLRLSLREKLGEALRAVGSVLCGIRIMVGLAGWKYYPRILAMVALNSTSQRRARKRFLQWNLRDAARLVPERDKLLLSDASNLSMARKWLFTDCLRWDIAASFGNFACPYEATAALADKVANDQELGNWCNLDANIWGSLSVLVAAAASPRSAWSEFLRATMLFPTDFGAWLRRVVSAPSESR